MKPVLSAINAQVSSFGETKSDNANLALAASCDIEYPKYYDQLHMSICFVKNFHVKYRSNKVIWKFLLPSISLKRNISTIYKLNK